jgi:hypothetical protein
MPNLLDRRAHLDCAWKHHTFYERKHNFLLPFFNNNNNAPQFREIPACLKTRLFLYPEWVGSFFPHPKFGLDGLPFACSCLPPISMLLANCSLLRSHKIYRGYQNAHFCLWITNQLVMMPISNIFIFVRKNLGYRLGYVRVRVSRFRTSTYFP